MTKQAYVKVKSDNIIEVDAMMVVEFFSSSGLFILAEMRDVKAKRWEQKLFSKIKNVNIKIKRDLLVIRTNNLHF